MQIIIRKKLISLNNFISNICFLTIKIVCTFLSSFTLQILNKIEINIGFNGHEGQF